jgi:ABC-type transport system involved in multi-copper enzyme maturation permease subunit
LFFLFVEYLFAPGSVLPTNIGGIVYLIVTYLAFAICALEGVRHTADCISEEKREGTLGLLFLTDLNGYDVVFGKLAAVSLASAQALLAMVPILGCVLFLGGVTAGEIARAAIALVSLMYFSLSLGLWVSSRSRIASHAMGATLFLLVLVLVAPMLVPLEAIQVLSPARAFFGSADALYSKHAWGFWISLVFTQVFMANFLMRAAANTNLFREGEPMKAGAEIKAVEPRFSSDLL